MPLEAARAALDRYLDPAADAPLAVAVSGGGDSLALLALAAEWAKPSGRRLLVLNVDHQLNPASTDWARQVEIAARRYGSDFQPLFWSGAKPATGLPAAARAARHALLANAARQAGAAVILFGHTLDDRLEAQAMRAAGSSVPSPRVWSPSPAWPEGRGVFLLRPLLETTRGELRTYLVAQNQTWIEDPANTDPRFARAGARAALTAQPSLGEERSPETTAPRHVWTELPGALSGSRSALQSAPSDLAAACLCVAGAHIPPRGEKLSRAMDRLSQASPLTLTLAGARIEADALQVLVAREPGEAKRGGLKPIDLAAGEEAIWDGRFVVRARSAIAVRALRGLSTRLPPGQQRALKSLPPAVRGALPAVINSENQVSCPLLGASPAEAISLTPWRLGAFQGCFNDESQALAAAAPFMQMAKGRVDDYVAANKMRGA